MILEDTYIKIVLQELFTLRYNYEGKNLIDAIEQKAQQHELNTKSGILNFLIQNPIPKEEENQRTVFISFPVDEKDQPIFSWDYLKASACFPNELNPENYELWYELSEKDTILTELAQASFYGSEKAADYLRRIARQYTKLDPYHPFWKDKYSSTDKFKTYKFELPLELERTLQNPDLIYSFFEMDDEEFTNLFDKFYEIELKGLPQPQEMLKTAPGDKIRKANDNLTADRTKRMKDEKGGDKIPEEPILINLPKKKGAIKKSKTITETKLKISIVGEVPIDKENNLWEWMKKLCSLEVVNKKKKKDIQYTGSISINLTISKKPYQKNYELTIDFVSDFKEWSRLTNKVEKGSGVIYFDMSKETAIPELVADRLELRNYTAFIFYGVDEPNPCRASSKNWYLNKGDGKEDVEEVLKYFLLALEGDENTVTYDFSKKEKS